MFEIFEKQFEEITSTATNIDECFLPLKNLVKYSSQKLLHEKAISKIIEFSSKYFLSKLEGRSAQEALVENLDKLMSEGQLILQSELFAYLGHLWISVARGEYLCEGSQLHRLITSHRYMVQSLEISLFHEC